MCHRGYWIKNNEKNKWISLKRAIDDNLSLETDIRDYNGKLYISHDPITGCDSNIELEELIKYCKKLNYSGMLALNIKSDGIIDEAVKILSKYPKIKYFFFDMSIPELFKNIDKNIYIGISDISRPNIDISNGCWLDSFIDYSWINEDIINELKLKYKNIIIVSPELHKMDKSKFWFFLKKINLDDKFYLCTDLYNEALEYFKN